MAASKREEFEAALNTDIEEMLVSIGAVHGEIYARQVGLIVSMLSIVRAQNSVIRRLISDMPEEQFQQVNREITITWVVASGIHSVAHILIDSVDRYKTMRCTELDAMLESDIKMIVEKQNQHIERASR